jgi:hypothetical protein
MISRFVVLFVACMIAAGYVTAPPATAQNKAAGDVPGYENG